jgi:hypothetical protein
MFSCLEFLRKTAFDSFFYSNEHSPIHEHVRHGGGEAVFYVGEHIELRESLGLEVKDLARAEKLAEENKPLIVNAWNEHRHNLTR